MSASRRVNGLLLERRASSAARRLGDPEYAGDDDGFCEAYGSHRSAPDLRGRGEEPDPALNWNMVWLTRVLLAVVLASLSACTVLDDSSSDPDEGVPCPEAENPQACDVIARVNDERAAAGRQALRFDPSLARAAQAHAEDMLARNYFDHVSPDGRRFSDRAAAAGYQGFATGENIAQGQRSAAEVMSGWMNSPGHRRNILASESNEIGVGVAERTWVQVFGKH